MPEHNFTFGSYFKIAAGTCLVLFAVCLIFYSIVLNWEIDCFEGDNSGLIIVEIEIPTPDYPLMIPPWLGKEVTKDGENWSNYALALNPLSNRTPG